MDFPAVTAATIPFPAPEGDIQNTDLRDLIAHSTCVGASCTLEEVHDIFAKQALEFMAIGLPLAGKTIRGDRQQSLCGDRPFLRRTRLYGRRLPGGSRAAERAALITRFPGEG
jgi:hypothetical protein